MEKTLLDVALILVATRIGGLLSRKLKMPEVLGALLAGVLLGPMALNLVRYTDDLRLLADLGVILLMFLAGLETNVGEFKKAGRASFGIALFGVAAPLLLGTGCAYLFFHDFWENLFVGVILTATSVSITVETLNELGKLNTRAGVRILGAAVIDDVLGLLLISVVLALARTSEGGAVSPAALVPTLVKIVGFCAASAAAVAFLPRLLNRAAGGLKSGKAMPTLALAACLLAAFAAEALGIAAITGAYLCGLTLSQVTHRDCLERNVKALSSGFLSLIFFASVGIEADRSGTDGAVWRMTLAMFVVAVAGKVAGCGAAARCFRMSGREALQIGVGMISRGEVAIITANIGLKNGIISEEVYLPTLIVVILTTVVTPILLKLSFSHPRRKSGGTPGGTENFTALIE